RYGSQIRVSKRFQATWLPDRLKKTRQNKTLRREFAQHIMQNAAIPVVFELVEGIDAAKQRHALQRAIAGDDLRRQGLTRLQVALQAPDRHLLVTLQAQRRPRRAVLEGERQHTHADQVGAMDALKALADHGADAEQAGALGGPVARRAVAVLGAREHHQLHALL